MGCNLESLNSKSTIKNVQTQNQGTIKNWETTIKNGRMWVTQCHKPIPILVKVAPNRRFIIGLPALNWSGTGASVFGVVRNGGIKIWYTMVYPKITILMKLKNKPPIMMVNPWKYMEIGQNRSDICFLDNKFDVSQRAKMPSTWRNQNQQAASGDWWPDPPRSCQLQDVTS